MPRHGAFSRDISRVRAERGLFRSGAGSYVSSDPDVHRREAVPPKDSDVHSDAAENMLSGLEKHRRSDTAPRLNFQQSRSNLSNQTPRNFLCRKPVFPLNRPARDAGCSDRKECFGQGVDYCSYKYLSCITDSRNRKAISAAFH